jgi:hypothetical protein
MSFRTLPAPLFAAAVFATTATAAPPDFAPTASTGWFAYARVFIPPASGPGPVQQDAAHPLVTNDDFRATGRQATFPMGDPQNPILQPWAADAIRKVNAETLSGKPLISQHATCRPIGVTAFLLEPMTRPMYIVQSPREVVLILESFSEVRHIHLTGKHHAELKPSWYGDSIGHYEGDSLVVDTIGFNDKTFIDGFKTPHTTRLHTVERFHLIDGGKELQVDVHVEDPGAFTTPWNAVQRYRQYELVASKASASLAALATPEDGPLVEASCADSPNSLMFIPGLSVPQTTVPDF